MNTITVKNQTPARRNGQALAETISIIDKALKSEKMGQVVFSRDQWEELGGLTKYLDGREARFRNYLTIMVGGCTSPPGLSGMLQEKYAAGTRAESKKLFLAAAPQIAGQILDAGMPDDAEVKLFVKAANATLGELLVSALTPESIGWRGKILDADIVKTIDLAQQAGLLQDTKTLVESARQRNEKERQRKTERLAYEKKKQVQFMGIH